jgi:hypothetical protein
MQSKLNLLFDEARECKEKTHPCIMAKKSVVQIYKPDKGIKNSALEYTLFTNHPPKLCDCAIIYSKIKLALIEIKCGKITNSLIKDVLEKLDNTSKIIIHEKLDISKYILLYQRFDNAQIKKKLATTKIYGQPLISKKFENKAIAI